MNIKFNLILSFLDKKFVTFFIKMDLLKPFDNNVYNLLN